jgi:O-antigen biosynthesis protein
LNKEGWRRGPSKGLLDENTARKRDVLHIFRRSISLQSLREWRAIRTIARSGLFDREWYLKSYPDVVARGIDPVRHYVAYGAREGRDPSPSFSTRGYLSRNRDVAVAEVNPLEHFVRHGAAEGRNPRSLFSLVASADDPTARSLGPTTNNKIKRNIERMYLKLRFGVMRVLGPTVSSYLSNLLAALRRSVLRRYSRHSATSQKINENRDIYLNDLFERSAAKLELGLDYVPKAPNALDGNGLNVRLIAFYLPQFHPIPENDKWWGKGFTEWTNVAKAVPQFVGHYQPHLPIDLGFYDLRLVDVLRAQVALAKHYGIYGFCFHHYYFGGKRLLELPVNNLLANPDIDLPFCLCWANENWTRRWDGSDHEVLISQSHSPSDDIVFLEDIIAAFQDPRYIRVGGQPLLIVYRATLLPDARATVARWKKHCAKKGIAEPFLVAARSFDVSDPRSLGFDASVQFPPHQISAVEVTHKMAVINADYSGRVYDYREFLEAALRRREEEFLNFSCVMPSWDNEARKPGRGHTFAFSSPKQYGRWLDAECEKALKRRNTNHRLVFVNAWNEWTEGAHLEPDRKYGYAYLNATAEVLRKYNNDIESKALGAIDGSTVGLPGESAGTVSDRIIVVSHDAHPHGAQFIALAVTGSLKREMHLEVEVVLLGKGKLKGDFAALVPIHDLSDSGPEDPVARKLVQSLAQRGFMRAIVNTTVSGWIVPMFREVGIESICLIHELPGIIRSYGLEKEAAQIASFAKTIVFPAPGAAEGFSQFALIKPENQAIRAQGLYRRNKWRFDKKEARAELRSLLRLEPDAKVVLAVGYADHRKGVDLFVDCACRILAQRSDVDFIWVGNWDLEMRKTIESKLPSGPSRNRLHFVGYDSDTALYHAGSDVYALTSREDPFPSVVLDSFHVAVPVVAFASSGGAPELVEKVGGEVVSPLDTIGFSEAICRLLDTPELAQSIGTTAQAYVDQNFSFREYVFDLCDLLDVKRPRISVIVPNYNYARYLRQRLTSIKAQTCPIFEVIVLDDASTDDSLAVLDELAQEMQELRVVRNERNGGSAIKQWARGLAEAKGDLVWIAEADDFADPKFLATVGSCFVDPEVVLAYSQSQQVDANGNIIARDYLGYVSDVDTERWRADYRRDGEIEIAKALSVKNTIPNVSAVLFRRAVLADALKESLDELCNFRNVADWLCYVRVLQRGAVAFRAEALNYHRRHPSGVTISSADRRHLDEIAAMHQIVEQTVAISEEKRRAAREWHASVARQFGLESLSSVKS